MPIFKDSEQLNQVLKALFGRVEAQGPSATQSVSKARLRLRFDIHSPEGEVTIDGKRNPVVISYGPVDERPDLDIKLDADALHEILLGSLRLSKAVGGGRMKVRGPVFKTFILEDILHQAQALYPEIVKEFDLR